MVEDRANRFLNDDLNVRIERKNGVKDNFNVSDMINWKD